MREVHGGADQKKSSWGRIKYTFFPSVDGGKGFSEDFPVTKEFDNFNFESTPNEGFP